MLENLGSEASLASSSMPYWRFAILVLRLPPHSSNFGLLARVHKLLCKVHHSVLLLHISSRARRSDTGLLPELRREECWTHTIQNTFLIVSREVLLKLPN